MTTFKDMGYKKNCIYVQYILYINVLDVKDTDFFVLKTNRGHDICMLKLMILNGVL